MNIWLVSIFEQTPFDNNFSTRYLSIADKAYNRGHKISFFASTFRHNTKTNRFSKTTTITHKENYRSVYLKSIAYRSNFGLKRFYSHYDYACQLIKLIEKEEKPDVILLAFPPIFLAKKLIKWAKLNQVKIIVDVIDPWPDNFAKFIPPVFKWVLNGLFFYHRNLIKKAFSETSGISAISNQYLNWGQSYSTVEKPKMCFYPAVDLNLINLSKPQVQKKWFQKESNKPLTIIYAGSLASSYDIQCIIESAKILDRTHKGKIKFIIAGAGHQEGLVKKAEAKLENLQYLGRVDKETLIQKYFESDLGLTQHTIGASQSVTYKLFDLLGNGLPILNSLESEMKNIILDNKVGLFNAPGNANELTSNILYFFDNPNKLVEYSNNGLLLAQRKGDSDLVYNQFIDFIEQIADK